MLNGTEEILNIATATRTNTENLLPLLDLLKEPDGLTPSPIDELKSLLSAIIEILGHHTETLHRLESASGIVSPHNN